MVDSRQNKTCFTNLTQLTKPRPHRIYKQIQNLTSLDHVQIEKYPYVESVTHLSTICADFLTNIQSNSPPHQQVAPLVHLKPHNAAPVIFHVLKRIK